MKTKSEKKWNLPSVLGLIIICLFAVLCILPFIYMVVMSFT